jgi:hypothetical protein
MVLEEKINEEFCNCTTKNANLCPLCQKKLAFVDSPFGAIPSFALMEFFYEDLEAELEQKLKTIESSIQPCITDLLKNEKEKLQSLQDTMTEKLDQYETEIKENLKGKLAEIENGQKQLKYFVSQVYLILNNSVSFFSEIIKTIFKLTAEMKTEKSLYNDIILPNLTELVKTLKPLEKIMPQIDLYTNFEKYSSVEKVFEENRQFISNKSLEENKMHLEKILTKIPLMIKE